ncbi:MAG TPA: glutaminyl-peptide cyclotransferase [Vicinamibacterales bacterium]|nr:glutaminyl-peptide cyclotransferase [Vicinamibacterales bacterium]
MSAVRKCARPVLVLLVMLTLTGRRPGFAAWQGGPVLPVFGYTVVHTYPHDRDAFTQGLQVVDGVFYEGTGLNGRSSIRKVKIDTGEVLQKREVSAQYFGEGITVRGNELFQLTWQSGVALVYDTATFTPKRQHKYRGEGWGLTQDKASLIMSDGTEFLRYLDPATFAEKRRVRVTAAGAALKNLNELEYVKGEVFANVWQTDYVARVDPATGKVNGYIDFRGLLTPREREGTDVMNGIAYDEASDRLFITGKLWPRVFEVRITRK